MQNYFLLSLALPSSETIDLYMNIFKLIFDLINGNKEIHADQIKNRIILCTLNCPNFFSNELGQLGPKYFCVGIQNLQGRLSKTISGQISHSVE